MTPFTTTPIAALVLASAVAAQGADDCAAAQDLGSLLGTVAFDLFAAATDGGPSDGCGGIENDVWFLWAAPADGHYLAYTCGGTALDTRIALYDAAAACPAGGGELWCSDDYCGRQSRIPWSAAAGDRFRIRIGSGAGRDAGSFEIAPDPCPGEHDDGFDDNSDACDPALVLIDGRYALYADVGDEDWFKFDVAPGDTLTLEALFTHAEGDVDLALYAACDGAPIDSSTSRTDDERVTFTNSTGADARVFLQITISPQSPITCNSYDLVVRGSISTEPGANYCTSNPSSTGAPARMSATGSHSIAADDLVLAAEPVPDAVFLFVYGPFPTEVPFGNGLRCVAGGLTRTLPPGRARGNRAEATILPGLDIAPVTLGYFQCWFRDPTEPPFHFDSSDGYEIHFAL